MTTLFQKHGSIIGITSDLFGSIFLAFSLNAKNWQEISGGCSISCGKSNITVTVINPWVFYLGIFLLVSGFILQIIHFYTKK
ncbi:MAG: hypothetical protein US89_C0009G0033 [Candidatus Peregrinibacteria bacterium GW2011_GWF2_38_29]|nr:MAG: hypothetical protein US89_C0009G0033 [Candidatus Peregrinibacteria bacterium GW2011_GWF2_38_29]HBB02786.1 hypothetical protein [Candidatus Peregrinibacteria bacterium]